MKPVQSIAYEKEIAEREVLWRTGSTVQMIADRYSGQTGGCLKSVIFNFIDVSEIGNPDKKSIIAGVSVQI